MACAVIWLNEDFKIVELATKDVAYQEYNKIEGPKCIIQAGRVL